MMEHYEELAWEMSQKIPKLTVAHLIFKLKLSGKAAKEIWLKIMLRQMREARELAEGLENYGFPPTLQCKAKMKNKRKKLI